MISTATESIAIDDLIAKLQAAKDHARDSGQYERVRITIHHTEVRIITVPAYAELNPNFVASIPLA